MQAEIQSAGRVASCCWYKNRYTQWKSVCYRRLSEHILVNVLIVTETPYILQIPRVIWFEADSTVWVIVIITWVNYSVFFFFKGCLQHCWFAHALIMSSFNTIKKKCSVFWWLLEITWSCVSSSVAQIQIYTLFTSACLEGPKGSLNGWWRS